MIVISLTMPYPKGLMKYWVSHWYGGDTVGAFGSNDWDAVCSSWDNAHRARRSLPKQRMHRVPGLGFVVIGKRSRSV